MSEDRPDLNANYVQTDRRGVRHYAIPGATQFKIIDGQAHEVSSPEYKGYAEGKAAARLVKTEAGRQQVEDTRQALNALVRTSRQVFLPRPPDANTGSRRLSAQDRQRHQQDYQRELDFWNHGCAARAEQLLVGFSMDGSEQVAYLKTQFPQADFSDPRQVAALEDFAAQREQIGQAVRCQHKRDSYSIRSPISASYTLGQEEAYRSSFTTGWQSVPEDTKPAV